MDDIEFKRGNLYTNPTCVVMCTESVYGEERFFDGVIIHHLSGDRLGEIIFNIDQKSLRFVKFDGKMTIEY